VATIKSAKISPFCLSTRLSLGSGRCAWRVPSPAGACGGAIVAAFPRIRSQLDRWFGLAGEHFHAGRQVD